MPRSGSAEERDAPRALDGVRSAAAEWHIHRDPENPERGRNWCPHQGGRLEEAEALIARQVSQTR